MKKLVSACLMTVLSGMMLGGCQDMSPSNQRIGAAALGGAIGGGAGNHVGGGLGAGVGAAAGAGAAAGLVSALSLPPQAAKVTLAMADKMNVCANLATFLSFYFSLMIISMVSGLHDYFILRAFNTMSCCY